MDMFKLIYHGTHGNFSLSSLTATQPTPRLVRSKQLEIIPQFGFDSSEAKCWDLSEAPASGLERGSGSMGASMMGTVMMPESEDLSSSIYLEDMST